ncbi:MAG: UbiA family prenyltransferase [Candidatus Andersenbacteria bacterium]|nr:UbiA family prenyltransferase [Candidatus Andersenbacteria bacterium]
MNPNLPLAVDLDGTLTKTDTLIEATLKLIKQKPYAIFFLPWWLSQGKANLKKEVAARAIVDVALLPYTSEFLAWLKQEKQRGRELILITASDQRVVTKVADHFGIFSKVYGSDGKQNLSGHKKAALLSKLFGTKQFAYAGNSMTDLPVWQAAGETIVVNASKQTTRAAKKLTGISQEFPRQAITWLKIRRALRIHQWLKNLLLVIPLLTAHQLTNSQAGIQVIFGFLSFSFIASAIYLCNDLFDLESDRQHLTKRQRPFAAGTLHPLIGILGIPALVIISILLAWVLPTKFLFILAVYAGVNLAYTFYLKQIALLDVVVLACLYTLRILAGSTATSIVTSSWLFAFAMFMFLSLALIKRVAELINLKQRNKEKAHGRGYTSQDVQPLSMLGISSGYLSLLVLALYISSESVRLLYHHPQWLWLLIPLVMVWISRMWLLTSRGEMNEDPILFAAKDGLSYGILIASFAVVIIAT